MSNYLDLSPADLRIPELHGYLLGAINPRPIAFVATVDENGNNNLAPFSFFNVFGNNPPILIFSPARRGRDNTTKDTYENLLKRKECTVNIVSYGMTHQMVLASSEYESGVDEFVKSGFHPVDSELVAPKRVAESPVQFECRVREIINYGELPGAGNMIIAEVIRLHVKQEILDENGKIDPFKIDTVGRCGGNWYTRTIDGLFSIDAPKGKSNIGLDGMPESVRNSTVLTGNDLGLLGKVQQFPDENNMQEHLKDENLRELVANGSLTQRHEKAHELIAIGELEKAWTVLLA